jgi:hypothetical protein
MLTLPGKAYKDLATRAAGCVESLIVCLIPILIQTRLKLPQVIARLIQHSASFEHAFGQVAKTQRRQNQQHPYSLAQVSLCPEDRSMSDRKRIDTCRIREQLQIGLIDHFEVFRRHTIQLVQVVVIPALIRNAA